LNPGCHSDCQSTAGLRFLPEASSEFFLGIGIPRRLRDLGVARSQLRGFAEKAFSIKRTLRVNPQPVTVEKMWDFGGSFLGRRGFFGENNQPRKQIGAGKCPFPDCPESDKKIDFLKISS
jgi:hypothetical protein